MLLVTCELARGVLVSLIGNKRARTDASTDHLNRLEEVAVFKIAGAIKIILRKLGYHNRFLACSVLILGSG